MALTTSVDGSVPPQFESGSIVNSAYGSYTKIAGTDILFYLKLSCIVGLLSFVGYSIKFPFPSAIMTHSVSGGSKGDDFVDGVVRSSVNGTIQNPSVFVLNGAISNTIGRSLESSGLLYSSPAAPVTSEPHTDHHPPELEAGFKKHPSQISDRYIPRGQPIDLAQRDKNSREWGQWTFVDAVAGAARRLSQRQMTELYNKYPYGDIPRTAFPDGSWQTDPAFLQSFLEDATALVDRAMEAMLGEYGRSKFDRPGDDFGTRSRLFTDVYFGNPDESVNRSFQGLVQRILHAIMTEDSFTLVTGGHSAAAGHGNHLQQSYTLQTQRALEPVFARLGVRFSAFNLAKGGLGTFQDCLGSGTLYGNDVDYLIWDSGMTENDASIMTIFVTQAVLGGHRVPFLSGVSGHVLQRLQNATGLHCGQPGTEKGEIPGSNDLEQVETLPWLSRYLECSAEMAGPCRENKYRDQCWIERDDFTPSVKQQAHLSSQVKWHPGYRSHYLVSRAYSFAILKATAEALRIWSSTDGYVLPDAAWHMGSYYDKTRQAFRDLDSEHCENRGLPRRACNIPIKGASEYLPRRNAPSTGITFMLKFPDQVGKNVGNEYDPPDIPLWFMDMPPGAFDYLNVVENGAAFGPQRKRIIGATTQPIVSPAIATSKYVPGKGMSLETQANSNNCDGSLDSHCGRLRSGCLLSGHNDFRGKLVLDGFSGWLILNLDELNHGFIALQIEHWLTPAQLPVTMPWKCENNYECEEEKGSRNLREMYDLHLTRNSTSMEQGLVRRRLKAGPNPPMCDDWQLQFAVNNGPVASWDKDRCTGSGQYWVIVDDPTITGRNVELAIRVTGCGNSKPLGIGHVYWS